MTRGEKNASNDHSDNHQMIDRVTFGHHEMSSGQLLLFGLILRSPCSYISTADCSNKQPHICPNWQLINNYVNML